MEEQSKKNEYLSFKELLYFKEEIFRTLKDFEKKISEKTKESLTQFNTRIEETNTLINKYKNETNIFQTKDDFQKEKKEIINEASNLRYFNENFNALEIQIEALRKEFRDSCYKYDKIFIDQLTLPGIIGEKCKYKSIRDYIKHNIDEMNRISTLNQKNISDIKLNKAKLEDRITEFKYYIESNKQQLNHAVNLKIAQFDEKHKDRFLLIENDIKNLNLGLPIKERNNDDNNQIDINKEAARTFNFNQLSNQLKDKMDETLEKSKQMNLTVIRENEVTKYELNKVKSIFIELFKILIEKSKELENNKIIKEFMDKNKIETKKKKKTLVDKSFFITKRKNTTIVKEESNDYSKQFFEQKMKTNLPKNSSINLNTNLNSLKTLSGEVKDDGFIIGKGNIIDLQLNLLNKKDKNSSLFLRKNTKNKSGKSNNTSTILDYQNSSISIINENNNNVIQENNNILKPSLKQSNVLYNDITNKDKKSETIMNKKLKNEKINDNEENNIEKTNNINQKKIDDENIGKINNISQKKIKFDDENINIEKNNISQKQIKFKEDIEKNINNNSNLNNINNNINNNSENNIKDNINNKNIEDNNSLKYNKNKNFSSLVINEYQNSNTNQNIQKINQNRIKNILKKNENKSEQIKNIRNKSPLFRPSSTNPNSLRTNIKSNINFKSNNLTEFNDKTIAIADNKIIDMPLIPYNKSFLEIEKNKSYLEKRLIELEFFTKKKFDELVNEIKIFIPIHFNSYIKDYSLISSPNTKKKRQNKTKQISLDTDEFFHNKY